MMQVLCDLVLEYLDDCHSIKDPKAESHSRKLRILGITLSLQTSDLKTFCFEKLLREENSVTSKVAHDEKIRFVRILNPIHLESKNDYNLFPSNSREDSQFFFTKSTFTSVMQIFKR